MDNKQNRQFYWEVKDFMNKNPNTEASVEKKPNVVNSVKTILEQNNIYKQNSFNSKSNTVNTVSQVIKTVSSAEKGYDPSCVAYTKNQDVNGFKLIKEGIFDDIVSSVYNTVAGGSQKTMTPQESRERARKARSGISGLEQKATYTTANMPGLSREIDIDDMSYQPGTKLTPEQKAKRELETQLAGEKAEEEIRQTEAERIVADAPETQTNERGAWFSPKPSWAPTATDSTPTTPTSIQEPPQQTQTQDEDDIGEMRRKAEEIGGVPQPTSGDFVGVDITQQTPAQIDAMNDPSRGGQSGRFGGDKKPTPTPSTNDAEKQKYLEARKAYWTRRNSVRRQEAEDNLARTQFGKPSSAYQAGQMAANRQAQQRAAEGSGDWSEEKIARMAAKETELRFRTPEEREAKRKENETVVASLAKAADEVRAKEAKQKAPQITTGAKTESASKTSLQTYRA